MPVYKMEMPVSVATLMGVTGSWRIHGVRNLVLETPVSAVVDDGQTESMLLDWVSLETVSGRGST